ncbi:MAG: hypothetical protein ACXW27_16290 [Allosphingosinicella sp.]
MIRRLFGRPPPASLPTAEAAGPSRTALREALSRHPQLWWLTDVPMFLDEPSVDRLHGAIVQPEYVLLQSQETAQRSRGTTEVDELQASLEGSIPAFLKIGTQAKISSGTTTGQSAAQQLTKQFIYSSEQRLQEIVVAYWEKRPERVLFAIAGEGELISLTGATLTWRDAEALTDLPGPRPLLFFELPSRSAILPMAGGTVEGRTILLAEKLIERLAKTGRVIPPFPNDDDPDAAARKDAHWAALVEQYHNWSALEVIEEGFGSGHRIEWIDYRLKLPSRDKPVHIHFAPRGQVATGAFAYNFVRRGYKVGLRIVAQLKKGCDMNALALYER